MLAIFFGRVSGKLELPPEGFKLQLGSVCAQCVCMLQNRQMQKGMEAIKQRMESHNSVDPTNTDVHRLTRFLKSAVSSLVKTENLRNAEPRSGSSLYTQFSPNFSRAWVYCSSFSTWAGNKSTHVSAVRLKLRPFTIITQTRISQCTLKMYDSLLEQQSSITWYQARKTEQKIFYWSSESESFYFEKQLQTVRQGHVILLFWKKVGFSAMTATGTILRSRLDISNGCHCLTIPQDGTGSLKRNKRRPPLTATFNNGELYFLITCFYLFLCCSIKMLNVKPVRGTKGLGNAVLESTFHVQLGEKSANQFYLPLNDIIPGEWITCLTNKTAS